MFRLGLGASEKFTARYLVRFKFMDMFIYFGWRIHVCMYIYNMYVCIYIYKMMN